MKEHGSAENKTGDLAVCHIFHALYHDQSLFLASGYAEASSDVLASREGSVQHLSDLFHEASFMISRKKLQRYNPQELLELNQKSDRRVADRECVICGQSSHLIPHGNNEMVCETCGGLEHFAMTLAEDDFILAVTDQEQENSIPLPGGMLLSREQLSGDKGNTINVVRRYAVNGAPVDLDYAIRVYIGTYHATQADGTALTFEELAEASNGVKRLGVLRADVDNLGALFASGFDTPEDLQPHLYETLPRYMTLSAALTAFFQREINRIIEHGEISWLPEGKQAERRNVSIVYSARARPKYYNDGIAENG